MAITSTEIHNQSFSIDRKGYDVDEVDVFLEHVADEIDGLNEQIAQLEAQLDDSKFDGFDTPARIVEDDDDITMRPGAHADDNSADDAVVAELEARCAELEQQLADMEKELEEKKANDNAIAQALIIAQRSADTIQDAEDEAKRILDKAEADRQKVLDAIKKLEEDREDAREEYRDLLSDFIDDASRRLNELGGSTSSYSSSNHARLLDSSSAYDDEEPLPGTTNAQTPINIDGSAAYATPATPGAPVVAAATPTPSVVEKDFSGFGDVDDDFEFEEID